MKVVALLLTCLSTVAIIGTYYFWIQSHNGDFQLIKLSDNTEARCLDGSPSSFYFKRGSGDGEKKFIVYFQGGAWIGGRSVEETLQDAFKRSNTVLGSSNSLPKSKTYYRGIFTSNQQYNPNFYNWNAIYVNYCDGTGHQGYKKDTVNVQSKNLYFRGETNTKAIVEKLINEYGMSDPELILLSGCSAGGLAVYNWANYFNELFPNKIRAVPDSGLFLDMSPINKDEKLTYRNYYFKQFMQIVNVETQPPNQECTQQNQDQLWKCLMSPYLINYVNVPLFYVQSNYDQWSIPYILKIDCVRDGTLRKCTEEQKKYIEEHHQNAAKLMNESIQSHSNWGAWAPSCINHCYEEWDIFNNPDYTVPQSTEFTISDGIAKWLTNLEGDNNHIDLIGWPKNTGCSRFSQGFIQ